MSELNKNSQERLRIDEGYVPEPQQNFVGVHDKSCCGLLRRKYSVPLWLILLWNILLLALIVAVILLSLLVLKEEKACTSNASNAPAKAHPTASSECVSNTTEAAITIQTQSTTTRFPSTEGPDRALRCDVVIVGGGIDGLLLAYMLLVKQNETSVCIFEKENRLGGQIYDHFFSQASDIAVGLGHLVVLGSSAEERRVVEHVIGFGDLRRWARGLATVEARGLFDNNFDKLRPRAFPALNRSDTVKDMADDVSKANASRYIIAGDFLTGYLSPEGRELLKDAYDLKYGLYEVNPESFVKFLKEKRVNEDFRRFDRRPDKGLSELVRLLEDKVKKLNGAIHFQETVTSVNTNGSMFILQTANNMTVIANKTVLAVGPAALKDMEGDVIQNITNHEILKSIVSVPAFFGAAVYEDDWWKDSIAPNSMFISSSNCLGITMPYIKSANDTYVLQTIANTGYCSVQWGFKLKLSKDLVDREMKSALEYNFGRNIPDALSTVYKYWENGFWYVQKAGTKFSVEEIREWAKRPLPGSDVFLIGKAFYNIGGSLEDTFRSINETLVEGWKTELELQP